MVFFFWIYYRWCSNMWTSEYCRDDVGVWYVSPPEQETNSCIYIYIYIYKFKKKTLSNSVSILYDRLRND